jgi:ribosomal protein L40E
MRIDPSHICRQLASRLSCRGAAFSWQSAVAKLRVQADHCRECDHEVRLGDTICAHCGARDPVTMPGWVSTIIVGFAVVNLVALAGRVIGA